jgi:hypothetical protein
MIFSDMWPLKKREDGSYEICAGDPNGVVLANSLLKFLERFLQGNVFDPGGLYDWHDERKPA